MARFCYDDVIRNVCQKIFVSKLVHFFAKELTNPIIQSKSKAFKSLSILGRKGVVLPQKTFPEELVFKLLNASFSETKPGGEFAQFNESDETLGPTLRSFLRASLYCNILLYNLLFAWKSPGT